jgi:alpha-L-fucosidase
MAALFRRAGARYVVLTTKHHDGFQLWPSAVANPHAPGWQARRDLVGDLTAAVRRGGMRMGLYYSGGIDWTFVDKPIASFADVIAAVPQDSGYARYAEAQMKELVERYRPAVLWNDIGWPRLSDRDALFRWYYGRVPDGVVNDRFTQSMQEAFAPAGAGPRRHFDFATAEYSPETALRASKWEATRGLGLSFGYNRTEDAASMLSPDELVRSFVDVVSKNGNLLLNVGPAADGSIPHDQRVRLEALGRWLGAHGDAIYGTRPWTRAEGTARDASGAEIRVRYTRRAGAAGRGETLYALLLDRPAAGALALADVPAARGARAHLVGGTALPTAVRGNALVVTIPAGLPERAVYALRVPQPPKAGARSAAAAAGGRP